MDQADHIGTAIGSGVHADRAFERACAISAKPPAFCPNQLSVRPPLGLAAAEGAVRRSHPLDARHRCLCRCLVASRAALLRFFVARLESSGIGRTRLAPLISEYPETGN